MFKKVLFTTVLACLAVSAHAQVTVYATGIGNLALSSSGTALAVGDIVRVGYIPSSDLSLFQTSNSYSTLNALFSPVGEGVSNGGTLSETSNSGNTLDINNSSSVSGAFYGDYTGVSSTLFGSSDQGYLLYMWVFNSATPSSATQWGIFGDSSWAFPANNGSVNLSLSSANVSTLRGSTNGSNFDLANIPASVPEPTSISLLAGALVMGGVALRRRK